MSHKEEAVEALQKTREEIDPAWATYWTQRSQALSQIALVEAQEAANELRRAQLAGTVLTGAAVSVGLHAMHPDEYMRTFTQINPIITAALGIEGAE